MDALEESILRFYDNHTITKIFSLTLVGQDLSPFELQKLASACKRFHALLYNPAFLKHVFEVITTYGGSYVGHQILKTAKTKQWNYFLWRKVQGAIACHNLAMLKNMIDSGFFVNYTGQQNLTPLFLCVKYDFADGYELLTKAGALNWYARDFEPKSKEYAKYDPSCLADYHEFSSPFRIALDSHAFAEFTKNDKEKTYFEAIKEHNLNYPKFNLVYLCVAYHSYSVLQMMAKLEHVHVEQSINKEYRLSGAIDPSKNYTALSPNFFSLVSLELLRPSPSFLFIDFIISLGYAVSDTDRAILAHKLDPNTAPLPEGAICSLGSKEENVDLPKIKELFDSVKGISFKP